MKIPKYRKHKNGQAVVQHKSLRSPENKDGRIYLGKHDSPESKRLYEEFVRRLLASESMAEALPPNPNSPRSLVEIALPFLEWSKSHHDKRQFMGYKRAVELLVEREKFATILVHEFRPAMLMEFQEYLIAKEHAPGKRYARKYVNKVTTRVKYLFKWATARDLVPPSVYHGLLSVDPVRQGQHRVKEAPKVLPAAKFHADALLPYLPPTVAAMVQVQYYCGMRPGEVCVVRRCDLDMSGDIWFFKPATHKNEWRGQALHKAVPKAAQGILTPFFRPDANEYLFRPSDALEWWREQRRTNPTKERGTKRYPSEAARLERQREERIARRRKSLKPSRWQPGERYTTHSYRRAVDYGFKRAEKAGVDIPRWTPNQLRHTIATEISRFLGEQSAQRWLGQECLETTGIYVERDKAELIEIAKKLDERWVG